MGNSGIAQKSRLEADALQPEDAIVQTCSTTYTWGYGKESGSAPGPEAWWMYFNAASGSRQSPVNISPEEAEFNPDHIAQRPLKLEYPSYGGSMMVWNTGHFMQLEVRAGDSSSFFVSGGPLQSSQYEMREIHFHWGERDEYGSEHTIKGESFSMEVHLVHWNSELYSSMQEAQTQEDGLVIVSVLAKLDSRCNPVLDKLTSYVEHIQYKRQFENICLDLKQLMPNNTKKYWTYKGSMTIPPCYESVTWIIFNDTINVSSYALSSLRTLRNHMLNDRPPDDECNGHITKNIRPLQAIGTRQILAVEHMYSIGQVVEYVGLYSDSQNSIFTSSKDFTWTGGLKGSNAEED